MRFLEQIVTEPRSDFANRLELIKVRVVAREQERSINPCSLSDSMVSPDHNQIKRVAQLTVQIVFLKLQPVKGALGRLISRLLVQSFHHQSFTSVPDTVLQKRIDFFEVASVTVLGEDEGTFDFFEV